MEKDSLLNLIKTPIKFETKTLSLIDETIDKYPYFQPLYALKLKLLKHSGSFNYNRFLKETAARTKIELYFSTISLPRNFINSRSPTRLIY